MPQCAWHTACGGTWSKVKEKGQSASSLPKQRIGLEAGCSRGPSFARPAIEALCAIQLASLDVGREAVSVGVTS
eukprot:1157397-Pelagomonas_calceolata.AAC.10